MVPIDDLCYADLRHAIWKGGPTDTYVEAALRRVAKGEVAFLAARDANGLPVSIGAVDFAKHEGAGHLWMLCTHPSLRGLGHGTRLIAALERRILDRDRRIATLSVEIENTGARALYDRLGYTPYGEAVESWNVTDDWGELVPFHASVARMRKLL